VARNLNISKELMNAVIKVLKKHKYDSLAEDIDDSRNYGGEVSITLACNGIDAPILKEIAQVIPTTDGANGAVRRYLTSIIRLAEDVGQPVGHLDVFPEAFYRWLTVKSIDGWLYQESLSGNLLAWAVNRCWYTEESGSGDRYEAAHVTIELVANRGSEGEHTGRRSEAGAAEATIHLSGANLAGKNVAEVLFSRGYLKETLELREEYNRVQHRFSRFQVMGYKQFMGGGKAIQHNGDWGRDVDSLSPGTKFVNEEPLVDRQFTARKNNDVWLKYGVKEDEFTAIPLHHFLLMYDLHLDRRYWVHVDNIEPYQYDKTVTDKLVLPPEHRDLIDILVTDMDVFVDDIVKGKSGGTPILCYGEPGLGKTLTAEVYSEIAEKPLYKVHSGQLGTSAEDVESNLEEILRRAERWGAILLLDEADVYVAKRGNDLERNAVVASFLRALEYFNGLMFLTTNRIDDIDDAIVSRMVALFRYDRPNADMARRIWKVIGVQFGMELTDPQLDWLVAEFTTKVDPVKAISGRDIKQLLKLVKKYCAQKNVKISTQAFRVCAVFRGIK